jgi:hypothetical protein
MKGGEEYMQGKTTKRRHSDMLYIPHSSSSNIHHHHRSLSSFFRESRERRREVGTTHFSLLVLRGKHMLTRVRFFFLLSSKPYPCAFFTSQRLADSISSKHSSQKSSRRHKPTSNIHPLRDTTALLPLHIHNISVTSTPATHTVLLLRIPLGPVVVVLFQELLVIPVDRSTLLLEIRSEVGLAGQLAGRGVGGAVLDGGVSVAEVAEVVDVRGREEGAGCEGVDGCVAPLGGLLAWCKCYLGDSKLTLSIQKPPLRSIIWKKSS